MEGGLPFWNSLTDDIGNACVQILLNLLRGEMAAVSVILGVGILGMEGLQPILGAEAAIGRALFHQKLRIFLIDLLRSVCT